MLGQSSKGNVWRAGVSWLLLLVMPGVLFGQSPVSGAMLAARGSVAVNGRVVGNSQALLPGDLTVTQKDSGGNLTQNGTNAMLGSDTALRYEGEYAVLERGGVSANTQTGFAVQAGCWTVKPAVWNQWTEFAISYASAQEVLIQARGSDVRVYGRAQRAHDKKSEKSADLDRAAEADRNRDVNGSPIGSMNGGMQDPQPDRGEFLRAGQEMRREACPVAEQQQSRRRPGGGAASAATTGPLNSTGALYGGAAAAGVVTVLFLVRHDEPASPKKP